MNQPNNKLLTPHSFALMQLNSWYLPIGDAEHLPVPAMPVIHMDGVLSQEH